jgi:DNA (cytosine-5)-methyltransferase 1
MSKPLLLDLFCCAGGAAKGYADAGFEIIGVDIQPQPHYPFKMFVDNALQCMEVLLSGQVWNGYHLSDFDIIHASPECKAYTNCNLSPKESYLKLICAMRTRLQVSGKPYIIENVVGAKRDLRASLMLCGSMFGLPMQRHRLFEIGNTDLFVMPPGPCDHTGETIAVYGHSVWDSSLPGTPRRDGKRRPDSVSIEIGRRAMGISWMTINELSEALPPAYTQWIGTQILSQLEELKNAG